MEHKTKQGTEKFINEISRKTKRVFSSKQKNIIVIEAQRVEESVDSICKVFF